MIPFDEYNFKCVAEPATRNGQHLVGSTLSMKPSLNPSSQKSCGKRFGMHCSGLWKQWAQGKMPLSGPNGGEFAIWLARPQGQQIPKAMIYAITGDHPNSTQAKPGATIGTLGATAAWSDITIRYLPWVLLANQQWCMTSSWMWRWGDHMEIEPQAD